MSQKLTDAAFYYSFLILYILLILSKIRSSLLGSFNKSRLTIFRISGNIDFFLL